MDFLKNEGFSTSVINNIIAKNDEYTLEHLKLYQDNVIEVIEYFKSLGIRNINALLLYRTDIFLEDKSYIESIFANCKINNIIEMINEDIVNFELLGL